MRIGTMRALGASSVLALVAVAAIFSTAPPETPVEVAAPEPTTSTSADEPTTTTVPAFHYRVGVLAGLQTDNFWAFYGGSPSVWDAYILGPTKPALFGLDPATNRLVPDLASAFAPAVDDVGWHVDVNLRENLKWSDGAAITAGDYAFTFETVRSLGLGGGWAQSFPPEITMVEAIGEHTLRISFAGPPSLGIWPHAAGTAPVMPAHIWRDHGASDAEALYALSGDGDVGGGPLAIVEVTQERVVSKGNRPSAPDVVEYRVYPDLGVAVEALVASEVDTVLSPNGLLPEQAASLQGVPGLTTMTSPSNAVRFLGFNLAREPMSDPAFRQALALLAEGPGLSFVAADNEAWFDPVAAGSIASLYESEDPLADAIELLTGAGYTWETPPGLEDGRRVPGSGLRIRGVEAPILTILTPGDSYDPARPQRAAEIAELLGWIGFDCRPVETDFQTVLDLAFTPDDNGTLHYDMAMLGWTLGNPARPDFYRALFAAGAEGNNTGYASEAFAEALGRYRSATDHESARSALWEMEMILATDLPYLLLENATITEVYRSDRVSFAYGPTLGGLQGRLGGVADVARVSD